MILTGTINMINTTTMTGGVSPSLYGVTLTSGSTFNESSGKTFLISSGGVINNGTFNIGSGILDGSGVTLTGPTAAGTGTYNLAGGSVISTGGLGITVSGASTTRLSNLSGYGSIAGALTLGYYGSLTATGGTLALTTAAAANGLNTGPLGNGTGKINIKAGGILDNATSTETDGINLGGQVTMAGGTLSTSGYNTVTSTGAWEFNKIQGYGLINGVLHPASSGGSNQPIITASGGRLTITGDVNSTKGAPPIGYGGYASGLALNGGTSTSDTNAVLDLESHIIGATISPYREVDLNGDFPERGSNPVHHPQRLGQADR